MMTKTSIFLVYEKITIFIQPINQSLNQSQV